MARMTNKTIWQLILPKPPEGLFCPPPKQPHNICETVIWSSNPEQFHDMSRAFFNTLRSPIRKDLSVHTTALKMFLFETVGHFEMI